MNDVNKEAVTPEEVLNAPFVEGGEGTPEETEKPKETLEEPEKKEEVVEKPPVPYDRFEELNKELKETRKEIQDLRSKGKEEGLSEEEKKELAAKTYIEKTAREAYEKMVAENATAEVEREKGIADEIKFYNSVDKDFTEKVAEDIGNKYGTEKNPIAVDVAYNIFKNEKQLKSQITTQKPKLPNPLRSTDAVDTNVEKEIQGKSLWQIVQEAKNSLTGKK
jgi:hypothetical protein